MTQKRRLAVVALSGILLVGCSDGEEAGVSTSPGTTASPSSSPAGTTAAPLPNLPTDCNALGSPATRAQTTELLQLGTYAPDPDQPAPQGLTQTLGCDWFGGDVTGITLTISTGAPDDVAAAAATLGDQGYECAQDLGGRLCTRSEEVPAGLDGIEADIETQDMVFTRDGVQVSVSTSNIDGQVLLSEVVADIFA